MIGRRILHFEIVGELGRGGMGEVYRARDTRFEREVALKFLRTGGNPALLRPLIEEAIAASRLNVDSVVKIHADYESPAGSFLCMEYLPGGSLRDRLQRGPLPLEDAVRVGLSVARALQAAHAAGILHCDLKPANVLLNPGGGGEAAKVTDFGLARSLMMAKKTRAPAETETLPTGETLPAVFTTGGGHARPGDMTTAAAGAAAPLPGTPVFGGTRGYMSPEQERGGELDERSDLWSLGVLLFEMATGDNPLHPARLRRRRAPARPYSSAAGRRLRPDFPSAYWRLVEQLTARDPDRRPRRAVAAVRVLRGLLAGVKTRPGVPADPEAPRLFGRDTELRVLRESVDLLIEGRGGTLLIEGPQGSGKTALLERLRAEARPRGAVFVGGSCLPRETPLPYGPFFDAVEGYLNESGSGGDPDRFFRSEAGLPAEVASFLCDVIRLPSALPKLAGRAQLADALRTFVQSLARERSVVLVLDDLHLADSSTAELFASWARAARELPLLLVGTHDPDASGDETTEPGTAISARERVAASGVAKLLTLGALDRQATEQLLGSLLPELPAGHAGFDQVYWRTAGLPGFVVEIARLAGQSGHSLPAVERVLGGVMPESIRASLTLRMKRLEPADVDLIRAAAVAGERFAPTLLSETGSGAGGALLARLDELDREHHLVRREGDDQYRFVNPQVREFVLSTMDPETRSELHGRFADALERSGRPVRPEVMARHLLGAGRSRKAGRYLRAAAESALTVFAESEALRFADLAERSLPPGRKGDALLRDVHLIRALALESLGRYAEARVQAESAVRLARRERSRSALGEAMVALGWIQHCVGDSDRAERTLRRAEEHCRRGRNPRGVARSLLNRGHLHYQRGAIAASERHYRKALVAARRSRDAVMIARARANLANVHLARGEIERAAEEYQDALEFHRRHADRRTVAAIEGNLALVRRWQGRIDDARTLATASLRAREEIGERHGVAAMELRLAGCALMIGRTDEAAARARRAREVAEVIGSPRLVRQAELAQASSVFAAGKTVQALNRVRALVRRAEPPGESIELNVLELHVRLLLARGRLDEAAGEVRRARRIVARLGNPVDVWIIARARARLLLARHRFRDALRTLEDSARRGGRGTPTEPDVDGAIQSALIRAAASASMSRRAGDAHDGAARAERERADAMIERIAAGLSFSTDRSSHLARWRTEKRAIRRLLDGSGADDAQR